MKKVLYAAVFTCLAACNNTDTNTGGSNGPVAVADAPKSISYSIVKTYPHDTASFTQGLILYKGELYEGPVLDRKSVV